MKLTVSKMALLALCLAGPTLGVQASEFDRDQMLAAHNRVRATVGVPPLTYSDTLAASAQAWADSLRQSNRCAMRHSDPQGRYGENLFWGSARRWSSGRREVQSVSPQQVVDSWAEERADYDPAANRCAPGKVCGHYTQVVWRSTTTVGCGMAVCPESQEQIWVCQYQPPGNWVGKRPY